MNLLGIAPIVEAVGQIADDLFTSDEERAQARIEMARLGLEAQKIDADLARGQIEVNRAEAAHPSVFVAGWRPAVGWVCVLALGYQFLAYPLLLWLWASLQARGLVPGELPAPPAMSAAELYPLLFGLLGLGTMRSFEKLRGVARSAWK